MTSTDLAGRVAVVTGASSGIGKAVSLALADNGATVVAFDIQPLDDTIAAIEESGGIAVAVRGNLSDPDDVRRAVSAATNGFHGLDIAVNCAGIVSDTSLEDLEMSEWERLIRVNLTGTFLFSREVMPLLQKSSAGRLVLFSSLAARTGGVSAGIGYAASKGGVLSLSKWLARRYAGDGVTVNVVAPGPVDSPMTHDRTYVPADFPIARMGTPEELALSVLYLASDSAAWVTGHTLDVNGGIYMN